MPHTTPAKHRPTNEAFEPQSVKHKPQGAKNQAVDSSKYRFNKDHSRPGISPSDRPSHNNATHPLINITTPHKAQILATETSVNSLPIHRDAMLAMPNERPSPAMAFCHHPEYQGPMKSPLV